MAREDYEVQAKLELNAPPAVRALDAVMGRLKGLGERLRTVKIGFTGMATQVIAMGAAYFGISTLTRGLRGLATSIFSVSNDVEKMSIGLASVYAAVEKISFKAALGDAGKLRKQLQDIAIESVATTSELFGIFQGIYGPLRNAGLSIKDILATTNNTAAAAAALGIDYAQVTRDISMMARGTAGVDVKTFSLLKSMGLIVETTEQWNKMAPDKRAKRLMEVMGKMGGEAASAYGRTWAGLSSTFQDIMESFKRAFGSAVFERLKRVLEKVNKYLLENRSLIEQNLTALGERVGAAIDHVITRGYSFYKNAVANIDAIRARLLQLYAKFQEVKPMLLQAAKFAAVLQAASFAFNTTAPVIGLFISGLTALPGVISGLTTAASMLTSAFTVIVAKFEMLGVIFSSLGSGAAFSAIGAAVSSAAAAIAAAIVPILIIVAVVTAIIAAIVRFKSLLANALQPLFSSLKSIGQQLWSILKDAWAAIGPILEVLGGVVIVALIAALRVLAWCIDNIVLPPFRIMAAVVRWLIQKIVHPVTELLDPAIHYIVKGMNWLGEQLEKLVEIIRSVIEAISGIIDSVGGAVSDAATSLAKRMGFLGEERSVAWATVPMQSRFRDMQTAMGVAASAKATDKRLKDILADAKRKSEEAPLLAGTLPKDRPQVVQDFRGSKIEVKQEFRQADPDNVFIAFRDALEREAVSRTQSGFANALGR
jgi:hypothetical protein